MIPNTSRKPHVLENSGLGCTVVARPLFWDFVVFLTFLCDTALWQSVAVVWKTWNLDRMCARYSYLKLKKNFSKFCFSQIFFCSGNFFEFFQNHFWPNFFYCCWDKFDVRGPLYTCLVLYLFLFKNHFWPKHFFYMLR